jgi:hypothetical protein
MGPETSSNNVVGQDDAREVSGWMVAVAYLGTTWKQVACQGWC